MCGVLYFRGNSEQHKKLIINLLYQSRIRGLHAFGVSLRTISKEEFQTVRTFDLEAAEEFILQNKFTELIGHCRYDTSGDWKVIGNNQPIVIGNSILAFNGVVRMSTREEYQNEFFREYTTENDGEIVLRMLVEGDHRLENLLEEEQVSFAGVARVNGKMIALRNERRPLWKVTMKDALFVFSTEDIFVRAVRSVSSNAQQYANLTHLQVPPMERTWLRL